MSRSQIILTSLCVVLLLALYFVADKRPPGDADVVPPPQMSSQLNIKELSVARMSKLPPEIADSIRLMEDRLSGRNKNTGSILKGLSDLWRSTGNNTIAALYLKMFAIKENNAAAWMQAGDQFQTAFRLTSDSNLITPLVEEALFSYETALVLNPDDKDIRVSLANCILERTSETMKGVQLLLSVIETDSNHIKANLILGKWGIFSGQLQKALKRLKKVVILEPENLEAHFHLGQAFQGMGDTENAVKSFSRCIELSENPGFKENVEKIIENIRNS